VHLGRAITAIDDYDLMRSGFEVLCGMGSAGNNYVP
jgi:hypothetical protein